MSYSTPRHWVRTGCFLWACATALLLAGCDDDSIPTTAAPTYSIGGSLSGLASGGSLVVNDNGAEPLTLTASGAFTFATQLLAGTAYSVTVATQPSGQTCVVTHGSGNLPLAGAASVTDVAVDCTATVVTPTYTVGGTVSGLASGATVTLQDNAGDSLVVSAAGTFAFAKPLLGGAAYAVTVLTQPAGATCVVGNGTGSVAASNIGNVTLTCAATGLASSTNSSTAFAVLATSNARIAFLPGPTGVVPFAIDGTAVIAGSATRALAASRAKAAVVTASLVPLSFSPDSCTVDSSALIVSCIAYSGTKLAFLDVSRFVTSLKSADITATEFESGVPTARTSFSGGSCVLCGIVALTGQSRIVVSASDGYHVYAYPATGAVSPLVPAKSYAVTITENFAVDPVRLRIAASEYYPNSGNRKLRLIDLSTDKIYSWVTTTDTCAVTDGTACSSDFQFEETDSETFDLATGMLIMQSESGNSQLLIDLSQATFDSTALTFDAPHLFANVTNPFSAEMSGALASPANSWLFMVPEFSTAYAGVSALPPAGGASGAFPTYTAKPVFVDLNVASAASPCGAGLQSGGDPHSEGFTTSLAGIDVGLFITGDRSCIVKVDLKALYNAPRSTTDPTQVDPTYDLVGHNVLSYLKVQ